MMPVIALGVSKERNKHDKTGGADDSTQFFFRIYISTYNEKFLLLESK